MFKMLIFTDSNKEEESKDHVYRETDIRTGEDV